MKTQLNYPRTRRAVSSLYQTTDVPAWIKKVIKVSAINHRCHLCRDPKAIELIRELNESVKKIENVEGYFIFNICYTKSTKNRELNESVKKMENVGDYVIFDICNTESTSKSESTNKSVPEYSLWCNYARLPKTASIFSWLIDLEANLDYLIENIRKNKNEIIQDIENIIKTLNATQKQE